MVSPTHRLWSAEDGFGSPGTPKSRCCVQLSPRLAPVSLVLADVFPVRAFLKGTRTEKGSLLLMSLQNRASSSPPSARLSLAQRGCGLGLSGSSRSVGL